LATRDDLPRLEEIAAVAFRYGRYHADPFFPRALADARYRQWVRTAFESGDAILVSDSGFFHVVVRGTDLDLRLTAVDPSTDDPWAGADLLHAALRFGQSRGARRAVARLSSANTAVMNLYAASGFRFDHPSAVYHWRSSRMRDGVMA
jgi:GNAT superfamily N-acetyltransferase